MSNYIERYWRDATPEDAIKEPPMRARFRNGEKYMWDRGHLRGIRCGRIHPWYCPKLGSYSQCQVYDAPDPGEGWRLIDLEKETPKKGDQYLVRPGQWSDRGDCHVCFNDDNFYRRRIEQPKPEPRYEPFRWEDREQLRGRWIARNDGNLEVYPTCFFLTELTFFVGTLDVQKIVDDWRFLDTGEPVGRRVE